MGLSEELKIFLSDIPAGFLTYHADATEELDFVSQGVLDLFGYATEGEFREATGNSFSGLVHPGDLARVEREIQEQASVRGYDAVEYRIIRKDGSIRWVEDRGRLVERDNVLWFYVVLLDMTEKHGLKQSVHQKEELYTTIASIARDVLFDMDAGQGTVDVYGENTDNHRVLGFLLDKVDEKGFFGKTKPVMNFHERAGVPYEKKEVDVNVGTEGQDYWVRYQMAVIHSRENRPCRIIGRVLDNNEQKQRELKYRRKSQIDELTGIYNRSAARKAIRRLLAGDSCKSGCMLLCIDVDNFKQVNDQFGHPFGDQVLIYIAKRMKSFFRENDIYARFGGDEFIAFLPNSVSKEKTWARVGEFARSFTSGQEVLEWKGRKIAIKISVGGVYSKNGRETADTLYQAADVALYKAKFGGKNRSYLLEI